MSQTVKKEYPFEGFSPRTLDFLFENRLHDSKSWFEEHRGEYEQFVLNPLRGLVSALTPTMLDIDPLFTVDPAVNKTIARIYRDVRFSHDKHLYRDHMWITFMRNKKFWAGLPGYYFFFDQGRFSYGFGYYEASPESMSCFREMILNREKSFLTAFEAFEKQDIFTMSGEMYKRSKHPDQPENIRSWLDRKNVSFDYESTDLSQIFSPALVDRMKQDFMLLKPIYEFICGVEARRQR